MGEEEESVRVISAKFDIHSCYRQTQLISTPREDRYEAKAGELLCRFELVVADKAPAIKHRRGQLKHRLPK